MISKIRILPERVANMIAAGEVVGRPASVVKELVENSLDAGARDIRVEVRSGGIKSVRVIDDGEGMVRDDALLCLEQHATSKLRTEEDLLNVQSLGFRGEALGAIASVSRLRIATRPPEQELGTVVVAEGGRVRQVTDAGLPAGTEILVEGLFFNTPARRKFLRSPETELGHIVDTVTQLAVTHPHVRFDLTGDGEPILRLPPASSVLDRIRLLLGDEAAGHLVPIAREAGMIRLSGFAGRPPFSRASMRYVFAYVNHRPIRDRLVNHAILDAYRGRLLKGRYPVIALFLDLPPHRVDFNVHPAKAEVRFRDSSAVHEAIRTAVQEALGGGPVETARPLPAAADAAARPEGARAAAEAFAARQLHFPPRAETSPGPRIVARHVVSPALAVAKPDGEVTPEPQPAAPSGFAALRYVGQIDATYLVCQAEAGMVLIDQHAAHERILFERLRRERARGCVPSQALLFPVTAEFSRREAGLLAKALPDLERIGIGIEVFGQASFLVRSLPASLDEAACRELLRSIVDDLAQVEKSGRLNDLFDDILARVACKAAVKAGQRLTEAEVGEILTGLARADLPEHCPHGRPSVRHLGPVELERLFLRR